MKRIRKLKRNPNGHYCQCGCGQEATKEKNKFVLGHGGYGKKFSDEIKKKISQANLGRKLSVKTRKKMSQWQIGKKLSEEHKRKISENHKGMFGKKHTEETKKKISKTNKGKKHTDETKLKIGLAGLKCRTDGYCDAWSDNEYKKDCRKNYCENKDCNNSLKRLHLHHINLDKKDCRLTNLITLCISCHAKLHAQLYYMNNKIKVIKDHFIIFKKENIIIYIHKKNKEKVELNAFKKEIRNKQKN